MFLFVCFTAKLRRVKDEELPLKICLDWELENVQNHRLVLQENETGEIDVCICIVVRLAEDGTLKNQFVPYVKFLISLNFIYVLFAKLKIAAETMSISFCLFHSVSSRQSYLGLN